MRNQLKIMQTTSETPESLKIKQHREASYLALKAVPGSELAKVRAMISTLSIDPVGLPPPLLEPIQYEDYARETLRKRAVTERIHRLLLQDNKKQSAQGIIN